MARKLKLSDLANAKEEGYDENGWIMILSDMMMLLLTFFVLLFIVIEPSDQDYIGTLKKVGDALGGKSMVDRKADKRDELKEKFDGLIKDSNLVRQAKMEVDARGLVLFAEGDLFFKPGTVELTDDVKFFLKRIAKLMKKTKYDVLVEGHTDDIPIKSKKFPSNWELSTARASAVVRYFIEELKQDPSKFAAMGYAHYRPRYAVIPENRAKNRRVEIVILRGKTK